jgi:malonate-semialdehyde dehydrogenase (acetylating) / methylmalonate-semialdehyde dehydrogenase
MGTVAEVAQVKNFIGGKWHVSVATQKLPIQNPATRETIGFVPIGSASDVAQAVEAAAQAFPAWRRTPAGDRIQFLFKMKRVMDENLRSIAEVLTAENGKTIAEAEAEIRRGIENVEVACGIPSLMQGYNSEDIATGIDETMIRQPLGVVTAITPFNFPCMIPFWFLPYAIACGNTFVLKPSERVPLTMQRVLELIEPIGLPPGVLNTVNGGRETVDALITHPEVKAVSFVGSTPVAKHVYLEAARYGKRAQCQGGAKNHVLVMPDADMETTTKIIGDSAFGCAGQRCLAVAVAITVDEARDDFGQRIADMAAALSVGNGAERGVQMGPVITPESRQRIESLIDRAEKDGAKIKAGAKPKGDGNFVAPTILDGVPINSPVAQTEIFGPVLSLVHARSMEEGIEMLSRSSFGNAASIFTGSGAAARKFRYEAPAGNIGVNIGVAAPMAHFPFSGWKESFFGVMHAQGRDGVEFYTEKKVVVERWPKEWSRKF